MLFAISLLVVGLLAFGAGYLLGSGDEQVVALPPSPAPSPSPSPSPAVTETPSPTPGAEPAGPLPDGRYFVDATQVLDGPPQTLEFDLAYLLTGSEARQAAVDHGQDPELGFFVLNDNALLRRLPVSPVVQVRYVPEGLCCDLRSGLFDPWAAAVNEELQTDYAGSDAYWWIVVRDGEVQQIEEQVLP